MSLAGRRLKYVRMKGGWGYGTIIKAETEEHIVAHLDCQREGETWHINPDALGKWYFLCDVND